MHASSAGRALIEHSEGLYLRAYRCPAGIWTIGYGHTGLVFGVAIHAGMTITAAQADQLLAEDLVHFEAAVAKLVKVPLTPQQNDALVSFTLNVGEENLRASTLLRQLNGRHYDAVPAQLIRWNRAKGKVLPGLTTRRHAEAAMWTGVGVTITHTGPLAQKVDVPLPPVRPADFAPPVAPPEPRKVITPINPIFAAVLAFFGLTLSAHAADVVVTPFATTALDYGLVPILTILPGWVGIVLTNAAKRYLDQKTAKVLGDNVSAALNWAIGKGVQEAEAWITREDFHVQVDGWVAQIAVKYAQDHFPDLMKKAGGDIAEKVKARLASHTDLLSLKAKAAA